MVPKRIANVVVNALKGGVVPRIGLEYITVGRTLEIKAILNDLELVSNGGAAFRFITGKYGSGKSFLLQTIRNYATNSGFVVMDCDLSWDRRLSGTKNQGLATYKELITNMSTKSTPDGRALSVIIEKWISKIQSEVAIEIGYDNQNFNDEVYKRIFKVCNELEGLVNGYEFAKAIILYYNAYLNNDITKKGHVLKWFRGEYNTRKESKEELGINYIITDDTWYEFIKIIASFVVSCGYKGVIIIIDELVNLYKIPHSISRNYNYEKILTMYNDTMQGKASHIGFLMGSTIQAIEDKYRGIFSYEALKSRLQTGHFASDNLVDLTGPIIKLNMLNQSEVFVLLEKLSDIHSELFNYQKQVTQADLKYFLQVEYNRVGASLLITPREIIRDFIELLNIIMQNPNITIKSILENNSFELSKGGLNEEDIHEEFKEFDI